MWVQSMNNDYSEYICKIDKASEGPNLSYLLIIPTINEKTSVCVHSLEQQTTKTGPFWYLIVFILELNDKLLNITWKHWSILMLPNQKAVSDYDAGSCLVILLHLA